MHNSWLRRSGTVQSFLKQHDIRNKRTVQDGLFSCVIVLSKERVLKITVDVYSYLLYLHLTKKGIVSNIPKLHRDYGCIGYVENPNCSEERLPVVAYEMENIPHNHLYAYAKKVSIQHMAIKRDCFVELENIWDFNIKMHRYVKSMDASVATTLSHVKAYATKMENREWLIKQLAKKGIKLESTYDREFYWDIHESNFAIHKNKLILLDIIKENGLCNDMPSY